LTNRLSWVGALLAGVLLPCQATAADAGEPLVTIDGRKPVRELPRFAAYTNTSLRYAPPTELAAMVEREYGRPRITRCWLPLDDMWDYRDGKYYFNFQLGFDRYKNDTVKHKYDRGEITAFDLYFYDYMAAFSRHSEAILFNVRRYEHEVTKGIIPMGKWKEVVKTGLRHYKQRYGNIRYIEALNEYHGEIFGGLDNEQYYGFYRVMYEVVNELNDELKPAVPLEIGGPCVVGQPFTPEDPTRAVTPRPSAGRRLYRFFQNFAADPNPRKRLDFVSFHDYRFGDNPPAIADREPLVRRWLKENGIRDNLPLFETEIGRSYRPRRFDPLANQQHAAEMSSYFYWTRAANRYRLFPWVLYHDPAVQLWFVAFQKDLRMTPFGAVLKMWSLQKRREVATVWKQPEKRLGAIATADETGMAIQVWNQSEKPASVRLELAGLPKAASGSIRFREYRVDSKNNNSLADPNSKGVFTALKDQRQSKASRQWSTTLEPYSQVLWILEPAAKGK
jgi:hypothetical protein